MAMCIYSETPGPLNIINVDTSVVQINFNFTSTGK